MSELDLAFTKGLHVAFEAGQVKSWTDAVEVSRRMIDRHSTAMVSDGLALAHWIQKHAEALAEAEAAVVKVLDGAFGSKEILEPIGASTLDAPASKSNERRVADQKGEKW